MNYQSGTNHKLDVYLVQKKPEELFSVIEFFYGNTSTSCDSEPILYTNVDGSIQVSEHNVLARRFDTFLYDEQKDLLLGLMQGGMVNEHHVRDCLEQYHVSYHEVIFPKEYRKFHVSEKMDLLPELWIARDLAVLDDALIDTRENSSLRRCEHYLFPASLQIQYQDYQEQTYLFDFRVFSGALQLDDKIVFLTDQIGSCMSPLDVRQMAHRHGFDYRLYPSGRPKSLRRHSVQRKK